MESESVVRILQLSKELQKQTANAYAPNYEYIMGLCDSIVVHAESILSWAQQQNEA
jgi:hypothetical protein